MENNKNRIIEEVLRSTSDFDWASEQDKSKQDILKKLIAKTIDVVEEVQNQSQTYDELPLQYESRNRGNTTEIMRKPGFSFSNSPQINFENDSVQESILDKILDTNIESPLKHADSPLKKSILPKQANKNPYVSFNQKGFECKNDQFGGIGFDSIQSIQEDEESNQRMVEKEYFTSDTVINLKEMMNKKQI